MQKFAKAPFKSNLGRSRAVGERRTPGGGEGRGGGDPGEVGPMNKRARTPGGEPPAGEPPPPDAAPLGDGDGAALFRLGKFNGLGMFSGGVFSLGTSPTDTKGKAPSTLPAADGVAGLRAALALQHSVRKIGQMAIGPATPKPGDSPAEGTSKTFAFGQACAPGPAGPGAAAVAKVEGAPSFELPGDPGVKDSPRDALVAKVRALEAELEAARLQLARFNLRTKAQARMLFPDQWRDWAEGLPPGVLVDIGRKVVRSEEADFAARRKALGESSGPREPVGGETPACYGLLAFAMVCKPWRKAQREIGGPLRSRVSDVMAKGSVKFADWALAEGCPKKRPWSEGKDHRVTDLRGMAALTGNLPVLRRESSEAWAAWIDQETKLENQKKADVEKTTKSSTANMKREIERALAAATKEPGQKDTTAMLVKCTERVAEQLLKDKAASSARWEKARAKRERDFVKQEVTVYELAARSGSLRVLRWLDELHPVHSNFAAVEVRLMVESPESWATKRAKAVCAPAAEAGHLHVLAWAMGQGKKFTATDNLRASSVAAARGNQLAILKYLKNQMSLSADQRACTGGSANQAQTWASASHRSDLAGAAAQSGSKDLLLWLKDGQRWDGDAWYAVFRNAAKEGHVDIMRWVVAEAPAEEPAFDFGPPDMDDDWGDDFWHDVLWPVCYNGHLHVLHYVSELHGHDGAIFAAGSTYAAVAGGRVDVLEYLMDCGCEFDDELEECAEDPKSLPAWKWFNKNYGNTHPFDSYECMEGFCCVAASGGCLEILKWAMDVGIYESGFFYEVEDAARCSGHTELALWLEDLHNKEAECPACAGRGTVPECELDSIYVE